MDLLSNNIETLREYNSIIRDILNNVSTIYDQHYRITRLNSIYGQNRTGQYRNGQNSTGQYRNGQNSTDLWGSGPRGTGISTQSRTSRLDTGLGRTGVNRTTRNNNPTLFNPVTRTTQTNNIYRRNPRTTTHITPIWSPFTVPANFLNNFINNTLDTPSTNDFPSYQQIENSTISIKYKDVSNNTNDFCPITQESFLPNDNIIKILKCNHIFKRDSLLNWFNTNSKCPICRFDIRNHVIDSSNNLIESKSEEQFNESKNNIESKTNYPSINPFSNNQSNLTPNLYDNSFNSIYTNYNQWNNDISNNYSNLSNIVSNNFESVISNFENVFSGAIENTIQDLSNNNINAEICYEFLFPPHNYQ